MFIEHVNALYEAWAKLIAKNEPFYSSVRIDNEAIELLTPFCHDLEKHKGLYLLGFEIIQERNSFPKVSFSICSRPCVTFLRTEWELPNFPVGIA